LRWADVDLTAGRLEVVHSLQRVDGRLTLVAPKTPASHRTLPLSTQVIAALIQHRARQAAERDAIAERWVESGMVFTTVVGKPLGPDAVRRWPGAGSNRRPSDFQSDARTN
jgi:integrase